MHSLLSMLIRCGCLCATGFLFFNGSYAACGSACSEGEYFIETFGVSVKNYASLPRDVREFADNAGNCEHFAGEEAYDEKRRKFISASLEKFCSAAKLQSQRLKKKYSGNEEVLKILKLCNESGDTICSQFPFK